MIFKSRDLKKNSTLKARAEKKNRLKMSKEMWRVQMILYSAQNFG